jgi:hypothetical protein
LGLLVKTQERNEELHGQTKYTGHAHKIKYQLQKRARVADLSGRVFQFFGKAIGHGPGWPAHPSGNFINLFDKKAAHRIKSPPVSLTFFFPQQRGNPLGSQDAQTLFIKKTHQALLPPVGTKPSTRGNIS